MNSAAATLWGNASNFSALSSIWHLLGQLQRDDAFGLRLHTLPPEFEFGIDGSVEDKVLLETLSVKGADGRVVAHLLWYEPEAQVLSETHRED